jgi:hypothetical protein
MCEGLGMHFTEVTIGDGLTSLADGLPMRHITCQHNHVAMKGKLSWMSPEEWYDKLSLSETTISSSKLVLRSIIVNART